MLLMNWPFSFLVSCTKALKLLNCNPLGEVKPGKSFPLSVKILGKENKVHLQNTSTEGPQNSFICGVKSMPLAISIKQFHAQSQQDDTGPTLANGDRWRFFPGPSISLL